MGFLSIVLVFLFTWSLLFVGTYQLQSSQTQVLLQLKKHLEYPKELEIWQEHGVDFCSLSSTTQTNLTCQDNVVAELRIVGDKPAKVSSDDDFDGFATPNKTLSEGFSIDSFFTTLARLNTLRALSLVSLGIWGPIHDKIHRLYSLEYLDLSSNYLYGSVPAKISEMVKLQALIIDNNFLNGSVPSWFDSLVDLRVLSLKNNRLTGSFPSSFQSVKTLTNITLSDNEISGKLPDLSPLKSLYMLDLSGNKFTSTLPPMPKGLVAILLSNNSFSGDIPRQYGQLLGLQRLDLSSNTLTGLPPASLFSLPVLSYLNLESNMLSGSISSHVKCGDKLEFIDISDNKLTGRLPSCLTAKSDTRIVKANGNCLSIDIQDQHEESQCKEAVLDGKKSGGKNKAILVGMIFGIVVLSVLLLLGLLVLCRSYCPRGLSEQRLWHKTVEDRSVTGFASELSTNANFISQAANLSKQGLTACRSFSLEELIDATNNFDNSALLGEGSQCGRLYKGRLQNGTQVAIRCLPLSKKFSIRNVKLRLDLLSKLQHQHLVCLLGHCLDSGGRGDYNLNKVFLVYEFMPNGTFRDHLSEKSPGKVLTWSERLTVLIGVAKAVHFLHTGVIPGFFNNRLRSNNILLDQHRMAKLSDYGLSIISERAEETCVGIGDSNKSWQMTSLEDDAYSFGFIILEALVGPSLASTREAFLLKEMATLQNQDARARVMEPAVVAATSSQESVSITVSIMQKCISPDASRPSFEDVLWNLQYAAQVQATVDRERRSETASYI